MSPNEGTHTFSKARVMPKVFTDQRASEKMNAKSDFPSFSSITASPVHPLSVDCAGELKVGGTNAFYTPGGRLNRHQSYLPLLRVAKRRKQPSMSALRRRTYLTKKL